MKFPKLTPGLVTLNTIETVGLAAWLKLTPGKPGLAFAVLAVALLAEHIVGYNNFKGRSLFKFKKVPFGRLTVISLLEAGVWAGWLAILSQGGWDNNIFAAGFLFVGLIIHHITEMNTFLGHGFFRNFGDFLDKSFGFTVIETVTGIVWQLLTAVNGLLAIGVLFIGLLFEHDKAARVLTNEKNAEQGRV